MKRKDYYNLLPTEIREKAYANTDEGMLNLEIENVIAAISGGFFWATSPEGGDYWTSVHNAIHDMYMKLEQIEKELAHEL
jgi:hypothetical protein